MRRNKKRFDLSVYIHIHDSIPITIKGYPQLLHPPMSELSPKEQLALAKELAKGLNDMDGLSFYKSVCKRHSKQILYELYAKVLAIPEDKIRVSRGALFNSLLQRYEESQNRENDQSAWD